MENLPLSELDPVVAERPQLIRVSVTPFGLSGPRAGEDGNDLTALASGGLLTLVGRPDRSPTRLAGSQALDTAGAAAAAAALAALLSRPRASSLIDISAQETVVACTENAIGFFALMGQVRKRTGGLGPVGSSLVHHASDGIMIGDTARR